MTIQEKLLAALILALLICSSMFPRQARKPMPSWPCSWLRPLCAGWLYSHSSIVLGRPETLLRNPDSTPQEKHEADTFPSARTDQFTLHTRCGPSAEAIAPTRSKASVRHEGPARDNRDQFP